MPRKASGKHEQQRERTRRYRQRLRSRGIPEADVVDHAVAASVAALAEMLRIQQENAREAVCARREELRLLLGLGVLSDAEAAEAEAELAVPFDEAVEQPEALPPADLVRRVLKGAVSLLVDKDCDPAEAKAKVRRRLGRNGDPAELAMLIHRSGVSFRPRRRRKASRGYAS